jgi:hypothetical protein
LFALFLYLDLSISNPVLGASSSVTIAAPTGVTASDGDYVTKVGINWHTMRGARLYRIYRNTANDPGTATDIGISEANYYFDAAAARASTIGSEPRMVPCQFLSTPDRRPER